MPRACLPEGIDKGYLVQKVGSGLSFFLRYDEIWHGRRTFAVVYSLGILSRHSRFCNMLSYHHLPLHEFCDQHHSLTLYCFLCRHLPLSLMLSYPSLPYSLGKTLSCPSTLHFFTSPLNPMHSAMIVIDTQTRELTTDNLFFITCLHYYPVSNAISLGRKKD